jgi:hypothetical protein
MQTHELAEALRKLASFLKRCPNIDINDMSFLLGMELPARRLEPKSKDDLPIALSALLSLSRIDKNEWIELISDLGLQIEVRPRDASRDILGKVLRVLEAEPDARDRLQRRVRNKEAHGSPELARALSSLLNN